MHRVRARFQECVKDAATSPSHLGIVGIGLDLHFLNCFQRRNDNGAIGGVRDWYAINQIVVAANRAAGNRNRRRTAS